MALNDILQAMEAEASAELAQITRRELEGVAQIRAAAGAQIETRRDERRRAALTPLQHERARRLNRAGLAAQRAAGRAREELFHEALDAAKQRLALLRTSAVYPSVLKALVTEALAQIEAPARVHGDPRDAQLLEALCPDCRLELDLHTLGGVETRSMDGEIVVDNTLEARLAKAAPMLRHEFSQWDMNTPTRESVR